MSNTEQIGYALKNSDGDILLDSMSKLKDDVWSKTPYAPFLLHQMGYKTVKVKLTIKEI